ncbi:MAG: hypothetical protein QOH93_2721 [Chloroflexia bacterium]|nr:hypothetical protein [Chloroflexia bacterium]
MFKAVADFHRRQLLDSLAHANGQTLTELCSSMPMSRFGVMKHLDVLEQAGLVTTRKVGREKLHFLDPEPLQDVASWVNGYRRLWEERMDRLEDLINRIQSTEQTKEQEDAEA